MLQLLHWFGIFPMTIIMSAAVSWAVLQLAYILPRGAFAVFLTGALVYVVTALRLGNFGIDIWSLAPGVALMLLFARRATQRPTFGALTLLPVVAQAIDLGVTYLRFGSNLLYVPPELWVALVGGPFLGGAVAFMIGRLFKR